MNQDVKPTMHRLRPMYGYATLIQSTVDEEQRDSGLIVPIGAELKRGVILHLADVGGDYSTLLPEGTVVFYRNGTSIGDVVLVSISEDILAYEENEG